MNKTPLLHLLLPHVPLFKRRKRKFEDFREYRRCKKKKKQHKVSGLGESVSFCFCVLSRDKHPADTVTPAQSFPIAKAILTATVLINN